jgi:hypothetical protein
MLIWSVSALILALGCYAFAVRFAPAGARLSSIPPAFVCIVGLLLLLYAGIRLGVFFGVQAIASQLFEWPPRAGVLRRAGALFLATLGCLLMLHGSYTYWRRRRAGRT